LEEDERIQWYLGCTLPEGLLHDRQSIETTDSIKYIFQLGPCAKEKHYPLLSDDRFIKKAILDPGKVFTFGTDSLLRWMLMRGIITREEFIDDYVKLLSWNYKHLSPEPVYLLSLLPGQNVPPSQTYLDVLKHYQQTFSEI